MVDWESECRAAWSKMKSLSAENSRYKKWFDDHMSVLATHRIGGFEFGDSVSTSQEKLVCNLCGSIAPEPHKKGYGCA